MRKTIETIIKETQGRFLTVKFVKENGSLRSLNGKFHQLKETKKGTYLVMKDVHINEYRQVAVRKIHQVNSDLLKVGVYRD